jgi:hypothetical protein
MPIRDGALRLLPNGLELRAAPRACEGQLPGGSGNAPPILAYSGWQDMPG